MKMLKLFPVTLAILLLAAWGSAAETPSVDAILSKYVTAVGGKTTLEKVRSRMMKIKIESQLLGSSEGAIFAKAPNKQVSNIEIAGTGAMKEGFDGAVAWAVSPWDGLRLKGGDELAKTKRDAEFHRELKLKTLYPNLAYAGTQKVGDEEAYLLQAKPTPTSTEKLWFSAKTGLLVRQESSLQGPQGAVNTIMTPMQYKATDGIKYPSDLSVKISVGDQKFDFVMRVLEVKHNVNIEDAKFAKPSA